MGEHRLAQLDRLAALHSSGALSDEEFAQEKGRILTAVPDLASVEAPSDVIVLPRAPVSHRAVWVGGAAGFIVFALVALSVLGGTAALRPRMTTAEYQAAALEAHRTALAGMGRDGFSEEAVRRSTEKLISSLEDMRPPKRAQPAHDSLVVAYESHLGDIAGGAKAVEAVWEAALSPNFATKARAALLVGEAGSDLSSAWSDLRDVQNQFEAAGLEVPTLANPIKLMRAGK